MPQVQPDSRDSRAHRETMVPWDPKGHRVSWDRVDLLVRLELREVREHRVTSVPPAQQEPLARQVRRIL